MRNMLVRRLSGEDAVQFRTVRLEGLERHPEAFGASYEDEAELPLTLISQKLSAGLVFGGFRGDQALEGVIGVMKGQSEKVRHIATIWGMFVRPPARGTGLSSKLLQAAIDEASCDCRSIRLSVVATNEPARRLYQRAGFTEWAVDTAALFVNGSFHDEILMRLDSE
ncbi:GNAT family N-acetyltransferase [Paracoccus beibuensis]|uniref:GNAT family N-acetyltransferase n=1 Tax=Paracoccus beibuensis TaxID=547602 RepID=UPI00223EF9CD|nr:GNAT family N-acetyltransferase [Paracoccus beibuensis]